MLDHWYEGKYYEPWEVWQHARTDKWYCPYCAVTFIFYHYWEECTIVKEEGEEKYTGYFEMIDAWTHWARIKVNCLVCKTEGMTILEPEEHWDPWTCPCIPLEQVILDQVVYRVDRSGQPCTRFMAVLCSWREEVKN